MDVADRRRLLICFSCVSSDESCIALLAVLKNPGVGFVEDQTHQRDVVAGEAGRLLPDVAVAVQANDGQRVAKTRTRLLAADADFDQAVADFMYRLRGHAVCLYCGRPENCYLCSEFFRLRLRLRRVRVIHQAAVPGF